MQHNQRSKGQQLLGYIRTRCPLQVHRIVVAAAAVADRSTDQVVAVVAAAGPLDRMMHQQDLDSYAQKREQELWNI